MLTRICQPSVRQSLKYMLFYSQESKGEMNMKYYNYQTKAINTIYLIGSIAAFAGLGLFVRLLGG